MDLFVASCRARTAVSIALVGAALSAPAIVIRDDVPDLKYIEAGSHYPAVISFSGGTATLIAPQWLLTAGHVGSEWNPFVGSMKIGSRTYEAVKVIVHPEYPDSQTAGWDFALVKLNSPVMDVQPIAPYSAKDELGKTVIFVGQGDTGNGKTGPVKGDGIKRAATNVVTAANAALRFLFDPPATATPLEGISGPGDSGGPALLKVGGKLFTLGVSSRNASEPGGTCKYGSTEIYGRVSNVYSWIENTMQSDAPSSVQWAVPQLTLSLDWNSKPVFQMLRAYFDAFNSGDPQALVKFNHIYRADQYLQDLSDDEQADRGKSLMARYGKLTPLAFSTSGDKTAAMLLSASNSKQNLMIKPIYSDAQPDKLDGFIMSPTSAEPPTEGDAWLDAVFQRQPHCLTLLGSSSLPNTRLP